MCKKCDCADLIAVCNGISDLLRNDSVVGSAINLEVCAELANVQANVLVLHDKVHAAYALQIGQMH